MSKIVVLLTVLVVTFFIVPQTFSQDVIRMRFGHVAPPMHAQHKASEWFARFVEKESGGRIKCSTHPQGQLGAHNQMLEQLQMGTLEVTSVAGSALADFVPEVALISLPFMFNTIDEMFQLLDSPVGKKIEMAFGPKNLYCGGFTTHGFKAFLNRKHPIMKIEDMRQSKWRVIPNELFIDTYKAMGINPVTLPWPEVFSALQRGVIDGIDLTPNETWGAKIYEVVKYMSLCKLGQNPQIYVASSIFLQKLSPDLKAIVIKGMKEAAKWHTAKIIEEDSSIVIPDLKAKGLQINEVSPQELEKFRNAVNPVHEKWRSKIGSEIYDETVKYLKKIRGV